MKKQPHKNKTKTKKKRNKNQLNPMNASKIRFTVNSTKQIQSKDEDKAARARL